MSKIVERMAAEQVAEWRKSDYGAVNFLATTRASSGGVGMTLEEFARRAGVQIITCGSEWGGSIGYTTTDRPNSSVNGFNTKGDAFRHWLGDTFGEGPALAVLELLEGRDA